MIGRSVRRDITSLLDFARGNLGRAARSIAETPQAHVGIVVGFFIRQLIPVA
jgi:hypothetical protein